jgi:hypothetical protein
MVDLPARAMRASETYRLDEEGLPRQDQLAGPKVVGS